MGKPARVRHDLGSKVVKAEHENLRYFEVLNVVGSTEDKRRVWIRFWEKETGKSRGLCAIYNCRDAAIYGGHMQAKYKQRHYILPICGRHNSSVHNYKRGAEWAETKKDAVAVSIKPVSGKYAPAL